MNCIRTGSVASATLPPNYGSSQSADTYVSYVSSPVDNTDSQKLTLKSSGTLSPSLLGASGNSADAWYDGGAWVYGVRSSKESRCGAGSYLAFAAIILSSPLGVLTPFSFSSYTRRWMEEDDV